MLLCQVVTHFSEAPCCPNNSIQQCDSIAAMEIDHIIRWRYTYVDLPLPVGPRIAFTPGRNMPLHSTPTKNSQRINQWKLTSAVIHERRSQVRNGTTNVVAIRPIHESGHQRNKRIVRTIRPIRPLKCYHQFAVIYSVFAYSMIAVSKIYNYRFNPIKWCTINKKRTSDRQVNVYSYGAMQHLALRVRSTPYMCAVC